MFIGIKKPCIFFIFYIAWPLQKVRQFFQSFEMCNSGLYWVPNAINQIIHFILIPSLPSIGGKILSLSQWDSLVAQLVKNPPAMQKTWVQPLGLEDPLEKGRAAHSSILAWRIPWTIESMGSERVRHNWVTKVSLSLSEREERWG